jgi:hypothetical protein
MFKSVVGIEIAPALHEHAVGALERVRSHPLGDFAVGPSDDGEVTFLQGDILLCPEVWAGADFLYVCCTCFDENLLSALGALISTHLKSGAVVATVSRRLGEASLEPLAELSAECTWGYADVFLERKM